LTHRAGVDDPGDPRCIIAAPDLAGEGLNGRRAGAGPVLGSDHRPVRERIPLEARKPGPPET